MRATIPLSRSFAALLLTAMAYSATASAAELAGTQEPVVLVRLSACVTDPGATAAFLEDVLGWKSAVTQSETRAEAARSGNRPVVLSDVRGFQLELTHDPECGATPYRRLSFAGRDLDGVLKRLASSGRASSVPPMPGFGQQSAVSIPLDVSAGTPVAVVRSMQPAVQRVRGAGTIRVDRIAIFVSDVERSARFYSDVLGLHRNPETIEVDGASNARSGGLRVGFIDANGVWLALVQPVGDGPLMDYLREHGDGHIAELIAEIDDLGAFYDRMDARGISLVDTRGAPVDPEEKAVVLEPYGDRIAYLPAALAGGLVIELAQRGPPETSLLERRDRAGAELRSADPKP